MKIIEQIAIISRVKLQKNSSPSSSFPSVRHWISHCHGVARFLFCHASVVHAIFVYCGWQTFGAFIGGILVVSARFFFYFRSIIEFWNVLEIPGLCRFHRAEDYRLLAIEPGPYTRIRCTKCRRIRGVRYLDHSNPAGFSNRSGFQRFDVFRAFSRACRDFKLIKNHTRSGRFVRAIKYKSNKCKKKTRTYGRNRL